MDDRILIVLVIMYCHNVTDVMRCFKCNQHHPTA